jgi:uncharacterized membrane protein YgdD (TMEM256/DUF423 family)
MATTAKLFLALGALAALAGVLLGAFGAHALKARLDGDALALWRTAVEYHSWHALGLLAVGLALAHLRESTLLAWSGALMLAGIVLFSGSLYLLALGFPRGLGAVTPVGGTAFIAAWILFAAAAIVRA